ncbi:MAG: peptidase and chymotrypsin/Hap [Actinomycetia bacterium]|nr:peptidase and chymotrypsin/Hap [Actinomycetes bacterium]
MNAEQPNDPNEHVDAQHTVTPQQPAEPHQPAGPPERAESQGVDGPPPSAGPPAGSYRAYGQSGSYGVYGQSGVAGEGGPGYTWQGGPGGTGGPYQSVVGQGAWNLRRKAVVLGAAVLLAVGAGGVGAVATMAVTGDNTVHSSPVAVSRAADNGSIAKVAAAVQPSVVSITATTQSGSDTGSGVIIKSDGTIMTNAHVVSGAQQVTVKFSNGKTATAKVLGANTQGDIAVVKATGVSGLTPATLGDSSALAVGDPVLAMGSPLGLDGSVTSGIVSALNRTITESSAQQDPRFGGFGQSQSRQTAAQIKGAIQTDAAINPGNSGGALVDGAGHVIGINTAIATTGSGSGSIGVGFAISANSAKAIADEIISKGAASSGT